MADPQEPQGWVTPDTSGQPEKPQSQVKPVPMFDPTGTLRDVPYERMLEARGNGFKPAVSMTFPSGASRWVPADQMLEASKPENGAKVNPIEDQATKHPAWYQHVLSDVLGTARGAVETILDPSGTVTGQDAAGDQARQMQQEKKAGYSLPYRAVAPLTPGSGQMEEAARRGDPTGVLAHAGANATMTAAPSAIAHGAPLLAEHPMVQALADKMTGEQLHSVLNDFVNDYHGTKLSNEPATVGRVASKLWDEEDGEAGLPPKKPSQVDVREARKPSQSVKDVANPARDTETLNQVRKEHPEWTLSQQLQEAAKRVNPK